MTYQEAQSRIDDARLDDEISVGLRAMNRLTRILRQRRQEAGALTLASPEVRFQIDEETNNPTDVGMYQVCSISPPSKHLLDIRSPALLWAQRLASPEYRSRSVRRPTTPPMWACIRYGQGLHSKGEIEPLLPSMALSQCWAVGMHVGQP